MHKIIIITTGLSPVVEPLCHCAGIRVSGIIDCADLPEGELGRFALRMDIPYRKLIVQDEELVRWIRSKQVDLMVVFMMPFLLKEPVYSIPKYGTINIHPSLLPDYRGINPWFWVYYYMEKQTGATVHFMDAGEDTGDIISQSVVEIPLGSDRWEIREEVIEEGIRLAIEAIRSIETIESRPQATGKPVHRAVNVREPYRLIDFKAWPVERVWHLLRGFPEIIPGYPERHWRVGGYLSGQNPGDRSGLGIPVEEAGNWIIKCKDGSIMLFTDL